MEEIEGQIRSHPRNLWQDRDGRQFVRFTLETNGDTFECVGPLSSRMARGGQWRLTGQFKRHPRWGHQFRFTGAVEAMPIGREATIAYLTALPGIGQAYASMIWDAYKDESILMLSDHPTHLAEYVALPETVALKASRAVQQQLAITKSEAELLALLGGRGFPHTAILRAIKLWGAEAAVKVRENPYLMAQFKGCGFQRCDELWLDLGLPRDSMERARQCVLHALQGNHDGSTSISEHEVSAVLHQKIGSAFRASNVMTSLETDDVPPKAVVTKVGQTRYLTGTDDFRDEHEIVNRYAIVPEFNDHACKGICERLSGLSDHQLEAVDRSLRGGLCLLTGLPGTGKSYTMAQIVRAALECDLDVAVAASTGKAARRCTELLDGTGVAAHTVHSMLVPDNSLTRFIHDRHNPLPHDLVIVDEPSMLDLRTMRCLVEASWKSILLLVGDQNQLPPVGRGKPFHDMVDSGVFPHGHLSELHRNAGEIARLCREIIDGRIGVSRHELQGNVTLHTGDPEMAIWDMMDGERAFITPLKEHGDLSRRAINALGLNTLEEHVSADGSPFLVGDPVVCRERCRAHLMSGEPTYLVNGDTGRIMDAAKGAAVIEMDDGRVIEVKLPVMDRFPEGRIQRCGEWELAYCLTVHLSQGSEWDEVVVVLDKSPKAMRLLDKHLLYTAFSRPKKHLHIVGDLETIRRACQKSSARRTTLLKHELVDAKAKKELL